ncbi:hypothetical protein A3E96_03310 [Candidatus Uhrbacteria bacterium RIFCSPHIGHO2_12_FULL_46_13]|nr:MAG: hypothetical protein A3D60_02025 [Candidatus Uhrbacteria bacterium RIFCSPHIGHO2_02_FULL_47_29]OGL74740.1 MAG: hypothetical protein A3E96_03310 [Candidatus Uhrbacteria bacterium RIFCSPHIGHO2_12_FULL_46_13]
MLCHNITVKGACGQCVSCRSWQGNEHPDLLRLRLVAGASSIGVQEVRDFIAAIAQTPFTARERIAVIEDLSYLTKAGFNALLKTLEEPSSASVIFLVAEVVETLLPTVRSRLQHCAFTPVSSSLIMKALQESGLDRSRSTELASLSNGLPGLALRWRSQPADLKAYEAAGQQFFDLFEGSLKTRFSFTEDIAKNDDLSLADWHGILSHWQLLLRDLLLLSIGEPGLISHTFLRSRLDEVAKTLQARDWLARYQMLEWLGWALDRNANRRLALNNFFITL